MNISYYKNSLLFFCFFLYLNAEAQERISIERIVVLENKNDFQNPTKKEQVKPVNSTISLDYSQNSLIIYFSPTTSTQYLYQLKNFSYRQFETKNNYILFTNLPNGEYELRITDATNANVKAAYLKIVVESPIWLRWWFLPMMFCYAIILIAILLYFLFQYRLRQQIRTQHIRDNIARDLHDDMGSYLSSISILSQNVEKMIEQNPEKAHSSLKKIGETARYVMDTMGDIVWSVNPNYDSIDQIMNRMRDFGNELFFNQDVLVHIEARDAVRKMNLTLEKKRDFFLIFKEALTNIYKYADASTVHVYLDYAENKIKLSITDNGNGFDTESVSENRTSGGNGLKNMRARAQKLNGTFKITSQYGKGTQLLLEFE